MGHQENIITLVTDSPEKTAQILNEKELLFTQSGKEFKIKFSQKEQQEIEKSELLAKPYCVRTKSSKFYDSKFLGGHNCHYFTGYIMLFF